MHFKGAGSSGCVQGAGGGGGHRESGGVEGERGGDEGVEFSLIHHLGRCVTQMLRWRDLPG